MQALQPSIKNGRSVWDAEALPKEEFQGRVRRFQAVMAAKGLDLALVFGRAFNESADPCYLTNLQARMATESSGIAVPREGEPVVFFEGALRGLPTYKRMIWVEDVRGGGQLEAMYAKYLEENQAKSVGLVGVRPQMPFKKYRALREALTGRQVSEHDSLVSDLRRVKSERELGRMRKAGAAVAAMFAVLSGPKVKPVERVIDAEGRLAGRLKGGEDVRLLLLRPGEWALRPAGNGQIAKGERILVYAQAQIDRYWAEAARTFVGTGNGLAPVDAGAAGVAYESMVKAVVAGKKADAPLVAATEAAARAGIKLSDDYGYGNGLGLSLDEAPVIAAGSTDNFEAGMPLSCRLFTKEQGGLMLGDTLIVHSQGSEILT